MAKFIGLATDEMTFLVEVIVDEAVRQRWPAAMNSAGPGVLQTLGNAFLAAQLGNAVFAAQAIKHDPDLVFSREMAPVCSAEQGRQRRVRKAGRRRETRVGCVSHCCECWGT